MTLLKLIALDPADLDLVSPHLQDAVAKVGDIVYAPRDQRLVLQVHRFNWADEAADPEIAERRLSVLRIDRVAHVQSCGFDRADARTVLSLLTLQFAPDPDPARAPSGQLTILCAGGASLLLSVECVELALQDVGPAWAARGVPDHEKD